MPLSDIPNQAGFKFTGIRKDGTLAQCEVAKHPGYLGTYYVTGEAKFEDLVSWYPNHPSHTLRKV